MVTSTQEVLDDENMTDWQRAMLFQNIERSRLSNERNLLNWIRTSLAFLTLGFVVQRMHLLLDSTGVAVDAAASPLIRFWVPLLFFVLSTVIIALGTWEYFRVRREIMASSWQGLSGLRDKLIMVTLVFLMGVLLLFIIGSI